MASCVAVLSSTNGPLYVHSADPSRALADQYSLHTSLDVIEEKSAHFTTADTNIKKTNTGAGGGGVAAAAKPEQSRDLYLGSLFATEKQKVYGYVTNTRVRNAKTRNHVRHSFTYIIFPDQVYSDCGRDQHVSARQRDPADVPEAAHSVHAAAVKPFLRPGRPDQVEEV
jgi:hypothetical protein